MNVQNSDDIFKIKLDCYSSRIFIPDNTTNTLTVYPTVECGLSCERF